MVSPWLTTMVCDGRCGMEGAAAPRSMVAPLREASSPADASVGSDGRWLTACGTSIGSASAAATTTPCLSKRSRTANRNPLHEAALYRLLLLLPAHAPSPERDHRRVRHRAGWTGGRLPNAHHEGQRAATI